MLPDSLKRLAEKFRNYESWMNSGFPAPIPTDIPAEYRELFARDPLSYFVYRESLVELFSRYSNSHSLFVEMAQLIEDLKQKDCSKATEIINRFSPNCDASGFPQEWRNTFEIYGLISTDSLSQAACLFYQSKYEINDPLLFAAASVRFLSSNVCDCNLRDLKDKNGKLIKGLAINYISNNISAYPTLKKTIDVAYNSKLRNMIGHNKYTLSSNELLSFDGSLRFSRSDFFDILYHLQEYQHSYMWAVKRFQLAGELDKVKDCGVISIGHGFSDKNELTGIVLFQLWCFYSIDLTKDWVQSVSFRKTAGELVTRFSDRVFFEGEYESIPLAAHRNLSTAESIPIKIVSIIPYAGDVARKVQLKWGDFQITDDSFDKSIDVLHEYNGGEGW
jgi:hypothetical protein